jgi:hypothetical protein
MALFTLLAAALPYLAMKGLLSFQVQVLPSSRSGACKQVHQERNDRQNQENVNQRSRCVKHKEAAAPQEQKQNRQQEKLTQPHETSFGQLRIRVAAAF